MAKDALTPTAEELIDELAGAFKEATEPPENSFTLNDFIALTGARSDVTAFRYLERLVMSGELKKVKIGRWNYYYKEGA